MPFQNVTFDVSSSSSFQSPLASCQWEGMREREREGERERERKREIWAAPPFNSFKQTEMQICLPSHLDLFFFLLFWSWFIFCWHLAFASRHRRRKSTPTTSTTSTTTTTTTLSTGKIFIWDLSFKLRTWPSCCCTHFLIRPDWLSLSIRFVCHRKVPIEFSCYSLKILFFK